MLNRREVLGAAASAVVAGGRVSTRAAEPWQFTLRVVGAAAFATSKSGNGYSLWLPSDMHEADFVIDKRLLKDDSKWMALDKNVDLRRFHHGLSDGTEWYRRRKAENLTIEGTSSTSKDHTSALAKLNRVVAGFGKKTGIKDETELQKIAQAKLELLGGDLLDGPPTGVSIGAGLEWNFHKPWTKNPTAVLSDCVDFVATVASNPSLPGIEEGEPITLWLINRATKKGGDDPKVLEHGRIYWTFYSDEEVADLPAAKVDADFPDELKMEALRSLRSVWPPAQSTDYMATKSVPYVELCYGAALDF